MNPTIAAAIAIVASRPATRNAAASLDMLGAIRADLSTSRVAVPLTLKLGV